MVMNPLNSMIPSSPLKCSSLASSLDSISSKICWWVYKHVTRPSTMWSIPCSKIMNDIFLSNVCARCLHTTMTLYGCHNGSFFYSLGIRK
jgi:hypothetical protein